MKDFNKSNYVAYNHTTKQIYLGYTNGNPEYAVRYALKDYNFNHFMLVKGENTIIDKLHWVFDIFGKDGITCINKQPVALNMYMTALVVYDIDKEDDSNEN